MQTQFEPDAEGVFDQPIKPLRLRKRTHQRVSKELFIPMTEGSTIESRAIRQTMRAPKLLKSTMPRVMPKSDLLAKQSLTDRSERLKFVGPVLRPNRRMKSTDEQGKPSPLSRERRKVITQVCLERRTRDRRTRQSFPKKQKARHYVGSVTTALFKPSVTAARELVTTNDSLFDKLFKKRKFEKVIKD